MLIELFQRLFGATRDAIAHPHFDAGSRAVELSATILRECIDLGSAWPGGPNRERLAKPFARGYIFGFSDACIQRFGVLDELELLALITDIHAALFGHKIGSLLVGDALRDQPNAEFRRGQIAGAEDLLRRLDDRSYIPLLLVRFLQADEATSWPMAPRWNDALVRTREIAGAAPDESPAVIRLRPRLKKIKPIEHS